MDERHNSLNEFVSLAFRMFRVLARLLYILVGWGSLEGDKIILSLRLQLINHLRRTSLSFRQQKHEIQFSHSLPSRQSAQSSAQQTGIMMMGKTYAEALKQIILSATSSSSVLNRESFNNIIIYLLLNKYLDGRNS